MLVRRVMMGMGMMALGCSSSINVGTDDGGWAAEQHDAATSDGRATEEPPAEKRDAATDAATDAAKDGSTSALEYTYCTFTSDAGAPTCSAFAPWSTNAAETAQAQLNCMAVHGSSISICPSAGLVGCCSTPLCMPLPGGGGGSCAFFGPDQPGENVVCNYVEDAGAAHVQDLECVAAGGTWTTTVPQ